MTKEAIIFLIVVLAAIAVFMLILFTRKKNISFDFTMGGDLGTILSGLQSRYASKTANEKGIGVYLDVPLTTIVNNKSASAMVLKNIIGSISYNGESILQTNAGSTALQNVPVAAHGSTPVTDNVQVLVNPSSIKLFTEMVKGNKPVVNYNMKTTLFGVPYSFSNQTPIKKS